MFLITDLISQYRNHKIFMIPFAQILIEDVLLSNKYNIPHKIIIPIIIRMHKYIHLKLLNFYFYSLHYFER